MSKVYRNEKDADLRERILLVMRKDVAEKEFHRFRWWAYKWLRRFDNAGLEGLKNKHRSGRPPEVSEETSTKIRKATLVWTSIIDY